MMVADVILQYSGEPLPKANSVRDSGVKGGLRARGEDLSSTHHYCTFLQLLREL